LPRTRYYVGNLTSMASYPLPIDRFKLMLAVLQSTRKL
jgi:hypothetical protein